MFEWKIHRKSILIWATTLFFVMAIYMLCFDTMKELAKAKFENLPDEYLQFVGISDIAQMDNYVTFFGMIFNLINIVISIFAITFGIQIIKKEESTKTIEYLYSLPVTRKDIILSKLLLGFVGVLLNVLVVLLSGVLCGLIIGDETFNVVEILAITKLAGIVPFFFLIIGLAVAATFKKNVSSGLGAGIVMLSYMLGYLGNILEDKGEFLKFFSPFELLSPTQILSESSQPYIVFGVLSILMILMILGSFFEYGKRDYKL